jgi:hypothetical protein
LVFFFFFLFTRFSREVLKPFAGQLLGELFSVLGRDGVKENDYVIKAILRITRTLQEDMIAHAGEFAATVLVLCW